MYKLYKSPEGKICAIQKGDSTWIPMDPANTDYQAFLKYKEEGGKVYDADEEVPSGQTSE